MMITGPAFFVIEAICIHPARAEYGGRWVAIVDMEVVCSAPTPHEAWKARMGKLPSKKPFITLVAKTGEPEDAG